MKRLMVISVLFFILAAVVPTGSLGAGILFGILLVLGWLAAIRAGRPVVAFYGSLGVIASTWFFMAGILPSRPF